MEYIIYLIMEKTIYTNDHKYMVEQLKKIDWPSGWSFNTATTDKGVILEIKSPSKRYFRSAFASVGDGLLDLNAVQTFAVRAENTIDRVEREKITV